MKHPSMQPLPTWQVTIMVPAAKQGLFNETYLWETARYADQAADICVARYLEAKNLLALPEGSLVRTRRIGR